MGKIIGKRSTTSDQKTSEDLENLFTLALIYIRASVVQKMAYVNEEIYSFQCDVDSGIIENTPLLLKSNI